MPAGDGPVTLTSNQQPDACDSHQPSPRRTIKISGGADYWTFTGLNIVHGAYLNGKGAGAAYSWRASMIKAGNWQARRAVPGTSQNDPTAAAGVPAYLANLLGTPMDPNEGIKFINNRFTSRGIYTTLASSGTIKDNTFTDIICGSGPAVWVMTFSNFWEITGNDITKVATSAYKHYMQEGIRIDVAANYNHIANNNVHDMAGDARGINSDVEASFNVFENNRVSNVAIAYNDQMAGWGNTWRNNVGTGYRTYCMGFRLKDAPFTAPSMNSSTNMANVYGNTCAAPATTGVKAIGIGAIMNSTFNANAVSGVMLGKYVASYWAAYGNTWNGSSTPPPVK